MLSCQIVNAHNLPRLVHPNGLGEERSREVQCAESASNQREAMEDPIVVVVEADDFPICIHVEQLSRVKGAGEVNTREIARAQQEAVGVPGRIAVGADDLSAIVDPSGYRARRRAGKVNAREIARAQEEAVLISRRVVVGANDLTQIIHALKGRQRGAGKVKNREGSVV